MFLPKLKVSMIDPQMNVKFISNYLSKEKSSNNTRPFYDKTVSLYPELSQVSDIEDAKEREAVIEASVLRRLLEGQDTINQRVLYFTERFESFIYEFIKAQCELFDYEWSEEYPEINCYVGYIPFYPRSTQEKCFFVSYQDEERVFSGAVHEINHMIFFEKWKQMHGGNCEEPAWPDPLWYLEEIIVDPTLNDERVKKYTLYENKAYPQFYVPKSEGDMSIMDKVKECYEINKNNIETFLLEAYEIVGREC